MTHDEAKTEAAKLLAELFEKQPTRDQVKAFEFYRDNIAATLLAHDATGYERGLREAAKIAREEKAEYLANAKNCDLGGNTFGGSMDTSPALGCQRIINRIEALLPAPTKEPTIIEFRNEKSNNP